ncbi:uncharacterized protein [Lolium perenne]|uniref:uncharacterized protein isoform X2 n=1 Tax=Lolium perenne TaxID=4522 RepID=UPI003A99E7B1
MAWEGSAGDLHRRRARGRRAAGEARRERAGSGAAGRGSSPSPSSRGQAQRRWMPLPVQLKPIPLVWHPNFSFSLLPQIQQQGTSSCQHDLTFLINPFLLLEWINNSDSFEH